VVRQRRTWTTPKVQVEPGFERHWPGASTTATECVLNAYVLAALIDRASQAFVRAEGLPSLSAFNVLTILHGAGEPLRPSEIAERLMVTRGTLTGVLDTLEARGLLTRARHERDGRGQLVALTGAGKETVRAMRPRLHRAERVVVAGLTADEQAVFVDLVARMQSAAETLTF
jgi:DNA-binding MarR family transcriptional regulator